MINALELDNFSFMGHVGQSAVSVPLTISEKLDKSGKDMLLALVTAEEVAGRMSAYLTSGPQQGHMRTFIHRIAGAVATGKLYELDHNSMSRALAIALAMPEFPLFPASFSPDTKVICTSAATVEGVRAAFMAMEGMDGTVDIIEHPLGLVAYLSYLKKTPDIWAHIGESWTLYSLSFKKYATCAYAQGPVNAVLKIRQEHNPDPQEIERIDIFGPIVTAVMEKFSKPHHGSHYTPVNTQFSTRRSVAATLLFGELTGDFFRTGNFESEIIKIESLCSKTYLHHSWQQTVDLIKGVDGGIEGAGMPGVLSFGHAGKALRRFKKAFGSRPLIRIGDLPELVKLSAADRNFLFMRFWKAYRSKLPFKSRETREAYRSHEGDLKKMSFPLSGRVRIQMKNGEILEEYCKLPPGFAGDPNREQVVEDKYFRETSPVWGSEKAKHVKKMIKDLPDIQIRQLMHAFEKSG
jgi:2-methylcitrate dehydratase PrpD